MLFWKSHLSGDIVDKIASLCLGVLQVGHVDICSPIIHNHIDCHLQLERDVSWDPWLGRASVQDKSVERLCLEMHTWRWLLHQGAAVGGLVYTVWVQTAVASCGPELLCKSGAGSLAPRQGLWKAFWLRGATALTTYGKRVYWVSVTCGSTCLCWGRATGAGSEAEHEDQLFRDSVKFPRYFWQWPVQFCDWATTSSVG